MKINFLNKCKVCAKMFYPDPNKKANPTCRETNMLCKKSYMSCQDKRVACGLCSNYDPKSSSCKITGQFKDEGTFRICQQCNIIK